MQRDKPVSKQLLTLQRLHSQAVEEAQVWHAKLAGEAAEKLAAMEQADAALAQSQSLARDVLGSPVLQVEALLRLAEYARQKAGELDEARDSLADAQRRSEEARASLLVQVERRSAVEHLIERREREAAQDAGRVAQKALDEGALSRLATDVGVSALPRGR